MRILVATTNPGKLRELRRAFEGVAEVQLVPPGDVGGAPEVVEDGATFEDNARKKAREVAAATGLVTLADDSGLEVNALGGAPGVHSARYAGEEATDAHNNSKLLGALTGVTDRAARFRCVLVLHDPGPQGADELVAHGTCEGRIGSEPRGDGGFGYDPLFVLPDGRTMAELSSEEKSQVSHRARATDALKPRLRAWILRAGDRP